MKSLNELEKKQERIKAAIEKAQSKKGVAESRLTELKGELPRLLATQVLGEVTQGEVGKAIREMDELKLVITQAPLTIQGLEELERENNAELQKVSKKFNVEKATQRYEELKAQMGNEYDSNLDSEIRSIAATIGQSKEADRIIGDWKYKLERQVVGEL